jgi:hypothetical protein
MNRYFINFRHFDTGLTPLLTFSMFKKTSDAPGSPLINPTLTLPTFFEFGNGTYGFEYAASESVIFEVDGGDSIPVPENRYVKGACLVQDDYLDEPVSQVRTDVLGDTGAWPAGSKGAHIDRLPTIQGKTDTLPADPASQAQVAAAITSAQTTLSTAVEGVGTAVTASRDSIKGAGNHSLTDLAGAGFVSADHSLKSLFEEVGPLGQVSNDTAAIRARTDNLPTDTQAVLINLQAGVTRSLGMLHENSVMDQTVFDTNNNLMNARLRLYETKEQTLDPESYSPIAVYSILATYTGPNLQTYSVVREV